jgi:hypothetical protein
MEDMVRRARARRCGSVSERDFWIVFMERRAMSGASSACWTKYEYTSFFISREGEAMFLTMCEKYWRVAWFLYDICILD